MIYPHVGRAVGRVTLGHDDEAETSTLSQPLYPSDIPMGAKELRDLVGDGNAKVSASLDIANKDFGNGVSAYVNVSLTCDQDPDVIIEAGEIATALAEELLEKAILRADEVYQSTFGGD